MCVKHTFITAVHIQYSNKFYEYINFDMMTISIIHKDAKNMLNY